MSRVAAEQAAPSYVRWACLAAIVFLFALPCIVGRLTTYFVLLFSIFALITPSIISAFQTRSRNPIDLMFAAAAALPAFAFLFTSEDGGDLLYAFNFAPLLLAVPFRWQVERHSGPNGALLIGWLSLAGVSIALVVALVQIYGLGYDRVGQPLMSAFHYANTAMLLGFMALVGIFAPGGQRRLLFLVGPVLGIAAVLVSGTRGALVGAPVLAMMALAFAFVQSRNRGAILAVAGGLVVITAILVLAASQLGLGRALDGFLAAKEALSGGSVDRNTEERLIMFWGGYQAFLHSPLFGYGWRDMVPAILPYVPANEVEVMSTFRQLHNGLLSFAVGAGVPGIVSFIILSVAPLAAVFRTPRDELFAARLYLALVLCVGYAVSQLTIIMIGFEFHTVQYAFMTMVIVGFVRMPARTHTVAEPAGDRVAEIPESATT